MKFTITLIKSVGIYEIRSFIKNNCTKKYISPILTKKRLKRWAATIPTAFLIETLTLNVQYTVRK